MRKLRLDLDELTVEAFETVNTPAAEGTVVGHIRTVTACGDTCYVSCNYSACPLDCTNGFYSECCSYDGCTSPGYTDGDACTLGYTCGQDCTVYC